MTVAELIAELQKLPQDLPVVDNDSEWGLSLVTGVRVVPAEPNISYRPHPAYVVTNIEGTEWPRQSVGKE